MIQLFLGYDTRETIAYHVCSNSIIRHATQPVNIAPLALSVLNMYNEHHTDGSNQFTYTRFLVPHLMNYQGWAIFMDGDMVVLDDISKLWNLRDNSKAVMVVKHRYDTLSDSKYFNSTNENYPRKNWSSVVLWNCQHSANSNVNPTFVQNSTGSELHQFSWLSDELIGELPVVWNWLADEYGSNADAKLVHYTLGTPCFEQYQNAPMNEHWHNERQLVDKFRK